MQIEIPLQMINLLTNFNQVSFFFDTNIVFADEEVIPTQVRYTPYRDACIDKDFYFQTSRYWGIQYGNLRRKSDDIFTAQVIKSSVICCIDNLGH